MEKLFFILEIVSAVDIFAAAEIVSIMEDSELPLMFAYRSKQKPVRKLYKHLKMYMII
jgi:hypothetical protein